MSKYIAFFSGQGSQYVGMAKDLVKNTRKAKEVFECGSDILGYDLEKICLSGSNEILNDTLNSQPAIFAHSLAAYYSAEDILGKPEVVAGHSLGEFAAMQVAEVYSVEVGFKIIKARAQAMQKTAENSPGAMAAILRVPYIDIENVCNKVDGLVVPVNLNTDMQTVISGEIDAVDQAIEMLTEDNKRARAVRLAVNSAFHTIMMQPAAEMLTDKVKSLNYSKTNVTLYSNVTGNVLDAIDYPEYFAKHMVSPVLFTKECASIEKLGIDAGVEFGPKKIVSGLVSKNIPSIVMRNIDTIDDLKSL